MFESVCFIRLLRALLSRRSDLIKMHLFAFDEKRHDDGAPMLGSA